LDFERALIRVDEFLHLCEESIRFQKQFSQGYTRDTRWLEIDRQVAELLPLIEQIANEVDPRLSQRLRSTDAVLAHFNQRNAARELRGAIVSREEAAEILGPRGPQLSASHLHPWVWDHAAQLWSDGHRRAAIQAAATALFDSHIPAKLGHKRDTRGGVDLMGHAWSTRPPEAGAPRLRLAPYTQGTPEWTSAHEGAMKLGQGAAQAIRNLSTHDLAEPEEQEGLEMLAVLSYVARLVDGARVETAR